MTTSEIFIKLHEFDKTRLIVGPVLKKEFGKEGAQKTEYFYSDAFYKDNDGNPCKLYFLGPNQEVWGLNELYPFGTDESNQNPNVNLKGYQMAYPMTSEKTVKNPTSDEKYIIGVFDALFDATLEALERECKKKKGNRKVPQPTYSSYTTAKADGSLKDAVKPPYKHPNIKGTKTENKEKPARAYVKLLTSGKGSDLTCSTSIYGPKDKALSARTLAVKGQRGVVTPVFSFEGVYWGQHGNTTYGASARIFLAECNYVPGSASKGPSRRLLSPNNAVAPEDSDSDEDSTFPSPTGEENDGFEENDGVPLEETDDLEGSDDEDLPPSPKPKKKPRRKQIKRQKE